MGCCNDCGQPWIGHGTACIHQLERKETAPSCSPDYEAAADMLAELRRIKVIKIDVLHSAHRIVDAAHGRDRFEIDHYSSNLHRSHYSSNLRRFHKSEAS